MHLAVLIKRRNLKLVALCVAIPNKVEKLHDIKKNYFNSELINCNSYHITLTEFKSFEIKIY